MVNLAQVYKDQLALPQARMNASALETCISIDFVVIAEPLASCDRRNVKISLIIIPSFSYNRKMQGLE
jgi:hypothetical protein